ncbi:MAG: LacI family transcriptional regulator [Alphaproteobacteria bacterium]|nr:LacI family transcriptional regulator [Alphaproteobacteria bacterium]
MADIDAPSAAREDVSVRSGRVTLRDIAEAVGVSVSTASRALNGAPGISGDVRSRIQSTAERLNYAGALPGITQLSVLTDLHLAEADTGEFNQAVHRGIQRRARELGISLTVTLIGPAGFAQIEPAGEPSGYLLLSMQREDFVQTLHERGIPAVIVNGREPLMRLDAVAPANGTGGYLSAHHLIELGHTRILTLAHSERPTIRDRMRGTHRAMRESGIRADDDLVVELEVLRTDVAYRAVKRRIEERGGADFTAVQCFNDACAFGAIAALAETGLNVPGDVSVIGFDDISTAALNSVPLTTVRVESEDIGARSVNRLVERIRLKDGLATYTETAVRLIVRDSTAPALR